MARRADTDLHCMSERKKLKPRSRPYFTSIDNSVSAAFESGRQTLGGLTLGYVSRWPDAGMWITRRQKARKEWTADNGETYSAPQHEQQTLGIADDLTVNPPTALTFEQAKTKAREWAHKRASGAPKPTVITVRDAIDRYLEYIGGRKGHKARMYAKSELQHVSKHPIANMKLNALTLGLLQNWQVALIRRDENEPEIERQSKVTANGITTRLKACLNHVYKDKANGIESDGAWRNLEAFPGVARPRTYGFTVEEMNRLIEAAEPVQFARLLQAAFFTGARYGELTAPNVSHFTAARQILRIPKGKTGERIVALTQEGTEFFSEIAAGRDDSEPLLISPTRGRWKAGDQKKPMKVALSAAGIPAKPIKIKRDRPTFYSIRHAYVRLMRKNGAPDWLIAQNCGTSVEMIETTYGRVDEDTRREMVEQHGPKLRRPLRAV